ncbi:EthD domain-containing protein [Denitratisoma oestradiolicum]|uniref:EthD domain-containing protein n=1 Tax=Denitratisoma oestradiolicum TaxID=311182 RepID=A0A6S6XUJ0_9PROT|nr:EthD domain-containing protein [Denitratisoma oestradiolicum]TWO80584.1 hypothetical protein CBW56_09100 [Denitratisoma oestradiolicum]CAB1367657.1 conserved protein of unknown function [Denitratisoma oestradiolicum]
MKGLTLLTRREGTMRQDFRDYYENSHAPLGMTYFPFRKYLRNHILASSADIDFDVVMESYIDDRVDVAALNSGEVRAILDVDERRFMNQGRIRSARVEEQVLSGPPIGVAAPGTRRQMLLLGASGPTLQEDVTAWGADLASQPRVARVSLDMVQQQVSGYGGFPYAAILSLWLKDGGDAIVLPAVPKGMKLELSLLTEVCETTPEELAARYKPKAG